MLENSRKRARKSKLEIREGVELEEATVLYMEALETKVKDEPSMDVGSISLLNQNKQIRDLFMDVQVPKMDQKPLMEFSVKIEVEECDETGMEEIPNTLDNESNTNDTNDDSNKVIVNLKSEDPVPKNMSEDIKPSTSNVKDITAQKEPVINDVNKEFKEYFTSRSSMLRITERLSKSDQIADRILAVAVRNYAGRVLDEQFKDARDHFLDNALQDWQIWYEEHSAVRDTPLVFKCYICRKSWWHMYDFRAHVSQHMSLNQFEIALETNNDECSLICFQLDLFYNDVELPLTNCDRCGMSAYSHAFVEDDPYKCKGCKTTFSTCTQLQLHEISCFRYKKKLGLDKTEMLQCSVCVFKCCTEVNLNDHMIRRHSVRSDAVTTWDVRKCSTCSRTYNVFALHVCIMKTNNYGCNFCGRSFQKKIYKEIHMSNYSKPSECRICGKKLIASCMEANHLLHHTDKYALMYKCIQCVEGGYYPDEFSIIHHTKVRHQRPFEKKFKYLEMVILPKQSLERPVVKKPFHLNKVPVPTVPTESTRNESKKDDVSNSNVFVPSVKYRTTHGKSETSDDVVVKQEEGHVEVDIDMSGPDLSSIKIEAVEETSSHIKISDITSLQDLIKFKTEPVEEVVAEDLIIIEDKSETITLGSSDDSENETSLKRTRGKRKKLPKVECACGFVGTRSRLMEHKLNCAVIQSEHDERKPSQASNDLDESIDDEIGEVKVAVESPASDDEHNVDVEGDEGENSDEDWGHGIPLDSNCSSGLKYTCHCKKVFEGTLAAFKRHKQACVVVAKMRKNRKAVRPPAVFPCSHCSNEFPTMLRYAKHFHKTHQLQKYMCPQCLGVFQSLGKLTSHLHAHMSRNYLKMRLISENQEWNKCDRCKLCKQPVLKANYFAHWEAHLVLNPGDGGALRDSDSLVDDDSTVTDAGSTEATSAYSPEMMQSALEWLQSPDGLGDVDEKTCVFCARRFSRKNDSKRHVIEHLLQDAYAQRVYHKVLRCQICATGFLKDDRFKHHMREHASLPVYQCNLCGKSFSDSSNFCKHRKVHGLSLVCCTVCEKKFHNRGQLARHMEMHEKTKPIICDTCGKLSYTQSEHKKHVRCVHERHKNRVLCPVCRASFTRLKDKWDHMWLAHKERKFEADCPICSKAFRRFSDVKTHVKDYHRRTVRMSADRRMVVYA